MDLDFFKKFFTSDNLSNVFLGFFQFIKRLFTFVCFYCLIGLPTCVLVFILPIGLEFLGASHEFCNLLTRILLTIAPVVPTLCVSVASEEAQEDELSMDFCFIAWIIVAVWTWKFF